MSDLWDVVDKMETDFLERVKKDPLHGFVFLPPYHTENLSKHGFTVFGHINQDTFEMHAVKWTPGCMKMTPLTPAEHNVLLGI